MNNYFIIYLLIGLTYLFLSIIEFKLLKRYVTDNADIRVVSYMQFMVVITFIAIEAVHYLATGEANQICILLVRNFLMFAISTHLDCKLMGYKNIYTNKVARNIISVVHNSLFFATVVFICMSYLKIDVVNTNPYSYARLLQILNFMNTNNYWPSYISCIPIIYCLVCCILIIYMDFKERRDFVTKFMGIAELTPLAIMIINMFNITEDMNILLRIIMNSLYFTIPMSAMANEGINTLICSAKNKKSKNEDYDDNKMEIKAIINQAFKENYKKITNTGKIQAKIIAREIEKDEELLWSLPAGKKNYDYRMYILNLVHSDD